MSNHSYRCLKQSFRNILSVVSTLLIVILAILMLLPIKVNAALKGNSNDVCLFYLNTDFSIEETASLVAYHDSDMEPVDWMFDGLILYSLSLYHSKLPTQTTCNDYINDLFETNGCLDKLNDIVGALKTSLGDANHKLNVFIAVPYAYEQSGGNVTNNITAVISNWNANSYQNLELTGFYWGYTEIFYPMADIQTAAATIHSNSLKFVMIPYSGADMTDCLSSGIDYITNQPNYAFTDNPVTSWFDNVAYYISTYGIAGAEMEITSTRNSGLTILENSLHYFEQFQKYKWNDNFMTTYYRGANIDAYCRSSNPDIRCIYNKLYRYVSPNLRGEWRFSEQTGTTVADSSENANNASVSGAQWISGGVGGALSFDGINDYVSVSDDSSLDISGNITVEAWIKPHNISVWGAIVSRNEYGRRLLLRPGGKIQAEFGGTVQTTDSGVINQDEWNHVVYTSDGTTSTIYVNGTAELTGAGGADFNSSTSIIIGKTIGSYYPFDGEIDEVKVYSRVLTAAEVLNNYQIENNLIDLAARWSFGENYYEPPQGCTKVYDTSENRNDGDKNGVIRSKEGVNESLFFDGVDDYIEIPDSSSMDINGAITVQAWVKPHNVSIWAAVISRNEYARRLLLGPGGKIQADFGGTIQTTATGLITLNEWNHIAYTSDGTASTIYVNGTAVSTGAGGADFNSSTNVFIGKTRAGYYPFDGEIDEVKVYSKVISAAEILAAYQKEKMQINKAAEWRFDENTGSSAADFSGNDNFVNINGAAWTTGIYGYALAFDGVNDYLYINERAATSLKFMDEISVEAWIKPDDVSTAQTIVGELSIAPGGSIKADFGGTVHTTSGCLVKPGEWNHIVYTSDGSESYIYVNGEMQVPGAGGVVFDVDFIGNDSQNATPFYGVIDEISIFRRVLNENEIIANYQNMLNLRAEWLLDENTGTTIEDSSQNTNTGTINGAAWTIGKVGDALYFDGIDDDVVISDDSSLDVSGAITVEAWINPDDISGFKSIISRNEYNRRLLLSGANVYAEFGGSVQTTTTSPIIAGEWNYIVYTSDGTTSTIYVNGVAELTGAGGADFSSSADIFIGKTVAGYYRFKGKIDEVKLYERMTSSSEVSTKYNNVLNLRAEWAFEENTGTSTEDTSQYTNAGTINGATWCSGEIGYALSFDGVDDYVQISDDSSLDINGAITVEAWIKPHDISSWGAIISRNEYTRRLLLGPGGKIQADFGGTIQTTATGVITANEWNHVAYTSDGTTSSIYVNGTAVLTGAGGADFNSNTNVFIGKTTGNYYPFNGEIDEVKIYGRCVIP